MAHLYASDSEYAREAFFDLMAKMPKATIVTPPHWQPTRRGAKALGYWRAVISIPVGRHVRLVVRNTNWLPDGANRVPGCPSAPWPLSTLIEEANRA